MKLLRSKDFHIIPHCFQIENIVGVDLFQNAAIPDKNEFFIFYFYLLFGALYGFFYPVNGFQKSRELNRLNDIINDI
jgi:hypothetical protein